MRFLLRLLSIFYSLCITVPLFGLIVFVDDKFELDFLPSSGWVTFSIWVFVCILVGGLIDDIINPRRDIYCTWCGSRKLKYLEGKIGKWIWKYRNTGGSQDKRVTDNFQEAKFMSKWQCKKCDAVSEYNHYVDKNPSKKAEAYSGWLVSDGTGERSKTNYESKEGEKVYRKRANRKGG